MPVSHSWLYLLPAEVRNFAGALTALAQPTLPSVLLYSQHHCRNLIEAIITTEGLTLCQTLTSAEQEVPRATLPSKG
jgi:hypothetical protein